MLNDESEHENNEELKIVKCPEVALEIENCKVVAFIDTGSKITCISEEIYNKYLKYFKVSASFPLVGVRASGFTAEKSVRLQKQFRARVILGPWKGELDLLIIPKLVRECILGMYAHMKLKLTIDFDSHHFI